MRILSIDFDWVMEPCIQAYNQYCYKKDLGPHETWEEIVKMIPAFESLPMEMDYRKFANLFFLLRDIASNNLNAAINICTDHEQIIPFIQMICPITEEIEIISIDHHHDLGYQETDEKEFETKLWDNTNWGYYLLKKSPYHFKKFQWIRNKNSASFSYHLDEYEKLDISISTNLTDIDKTKKFDAIFICSSFDWIPLKYRPLFSILVDNPGRVK